MVHACAYCCSDWRSSRDAPSIPARWRAVWPHEEPADRSHALQELVSRLRRALPDRTAVRSEPGGYLLDLPTAAVDATEFEELVLDAERLLRSAQPAAAAQQLRDGLALWRGDALADAAQTPFAIAAAARLRELRLEAVEELLAIELSLDGCAPVAELAELVAAHPIRERLRLLYIRALHAEGRNAEALRAY
ncbi:BTAD domain-containing putative transcriptional regulator [Nocardia sp. NPDC059229]|uniref:AfsR/SARP family transcriptional regulator n=1 Tax=Nocardia sp. NPDC059229 TaxID=3346778 RepID=UPI0036806F66